MTTTTGAERADTLLRAKAKANAAFYANAPAAPESRQVGRRRQYLAEKKYRGRENVTNRERVSVLVIASKTPRVRTAPRPVARHPAGLKHAWQRKRAAAEDLRRLLEQA